MDPVQESFYLTVMALVRGGPESYESYEIPFSFPLPGSGQLVTQHHHRLLLALNCLQVPYSGTVMGRRKRSTVCVGSHPMVQVLLAPRSGMVPRQHCQATQVHSG